MGGPKGLSSTKLVPHGGERDRDGIYEVEDPGREQAVDLLESASVFPSLLALMTRIRTWGVVWPPNGALLHQKFNSSLSQARASFSALRESRRERMAFRHSSAP